MILVKACLNGPRTKGEHEAVPILAAEIASDASAVVEAGAGALHLHPRDSDGRETLASEPCGEIITRVRELCPGVPVGLSTAEWIERSPDRKLALIRQWDVLPDFASVNFNEGGFHEVCNLLLKQGVGVEAGIWSLADAKRLSGSGLAQSCLRVLVEVTEKDPAEAVNLAIEIDAYLERSRVKGPRLHHGYGIATWAILANAVSIGRDIRAGMEDTLLLVDGSLAKDNRQLVEAAVQLVRRLGREPSRPEVRRLVKP